MADVRPPSRRDFLHTAGAALALPPVGSAAVEDDPAGDFILQSQPKPEPKVILPTDALPEPDGPRKRIAAITTAYFKYSHADDIITKFIEGYAIAGRTHAPPLRGRRAWQIEQFPEPATSAGGWRPGTASPCSTPPRGALTLGGADLDVDGVLLIGGARRLSRSTRRASSSIPVAGCSTRSSRPSATSARSVPVYNDKHFS